MRIATTGVGQLDIPTMKKYIQYCKAKCKPRLSDEAGDILASSYVKIRDDVRKRVMEVSNFILFYTFNKIFGAQQFMFALLVSGGWWPSTSCNSYYSSTAGGTCSSLRKSCKDAS